MALAVHGAIEELGRLNVAVLRRRYHEVFGEESRSSNKEFLFRRIAWRLQANAEGGLSERARIFLAQSVNYCALQRFDVDAVPGQC